MSETRTLSSEEVATLRSELDAGGTPTVWFTSAAVGVPEGRSGKVVSLDDTADGDFIQVRPAGTKDVLSFSAAEVTLVRPPRKRKEAGAKPAAMPKTQARAAAPEPPKQVDGEVASETSTKRSPAVSRANSAEQTRPKAARKPRQPSGATVILTADEAGQWCVEVSTDKKRVLKPKTVPASAVAQAAKALHDDVAAAVEPLISAARERQQARVEQLQQELAEAQRMLDELG